MDSSEGEKCNHLLCGVFKTSLRISVIYKTLDRKEKIEHHQLH